MLSRFHWSNKQAGSLLVVNVYWNASTFRKGMTKGRRGKLVASCSLEWNSSMVRVEFWRRERHKKQTHESMWKALSDNITYWKLSYILAWTEQFGFCNRKHMGRPQRKRATENKGTHLLQSKKQTHIQESHHPNTSCMKDKCVWLKRTFVRTLMEFIIREIQAHLKTVIFVFI